MIPRIYRLPAAILFTNAQMFSTDLLTIKAKDNGLSYTRLGFVVSKRTSKTAVRRNATKRKVRAIIEEKRETMHKGKDILFIIKRDISKTSSEELKRSVADALKKAKLIV